MGAGASLINGVDKADLTPEEIIVWLKDIPCFKSLDDLTLQAAAEKVTIKTYKAGDEVVRQGAVGTLFGILVQGELEISAEGPDGPVVLCRREKGYYFGEAAIMGNTSTTASITACQKSVVLGFKTSDLLNISSKHPSVKESLLDTITVRLRQNIINIPFFAYIEKSITSKAYKMLGALDLLASLFEVEALDDKVVLFKEGDLADKFYIICEGCVRISAMGAEDDQRDHILAMLTKNAVFGEIALLPTSHTDKRTASARTFAPSLLLSITKEKFMQFLKVVPDFAEYIGPEVSLRTGNSLKTIGMFAALTPSQRDKLGCLLEFQSYDEEEVIFNEGDESNGLYILVQGEAVAEAGEGADANLLSTMPAGSIMGEIALITGSKRTATCRVTKLCRVLFLPAEQFRQNFLPIAPELLTTFRNVSKERVAESIRNNPALAGTIPDIDEALRKNRRRGSEPELGHMENIAKYKEAEEASRRRLGSGGGDDDASSVATNTPPATPGIGDKASDFKIGSFKEEGPGAGGASPCYDGRSLNYVGPDGEDGGKALTIATEALAELATANLESPVRGRRNSFKIQPQQSFSRQNSHASGGSGAEEPDSAASLSLGGGGGGGTVLTPKVQREVFNGSFSRSDADAGSPVELV
eukprot:CAMPEP_0182563278 /NCGR_PEP_ID=MMETSP1324-20130603/5451_1 /TAXON_ID=236786 /ORGANISM="Florenciella sp., Strain RCC1587" /LENGTH=641 /DNA_ID=CAMNT_0024776433 /DNA_START=349 /DNA_END=2270 /DNA_ORIENTATION=+